MGRNAMAVGRLLLACAASSCAGSDLVLPGDLLPTRILMVRGDHQDASAGSALPESLVVRVVDSRNQPVVAFPVVFTALDGGDVTPDTVRTDADGQASSRWVLGADEGTQRAQALVAGEVEAESLAVTFTATANPGGGTGGGGSGGGSQAARIDITTQPSREARSGVAFEQQPEVRLETSSGEPVLRPGVTVVAALATGGGTLAGTTSRQTDDKGVARFNDLRIDGPAGTYRLTFSSQDVPSVTSSEIVVSGSGSGKTASVVTITSHTPTPSNVGQAVRIEVTVASALGGTIPNDSFRVGASTGESCPGITRDGECEIVFNSPGTRTLTATYRGSDAFEAATSSAVSHTVNNVSGATRTTIGTGPDPSSVGQPVTVFVTVKGTGGEPAFGTVNVYGNDSQRCGEGTLLGTAELDDDGEARIIVTTLSAGFHVLRGCFTGAPGFAPSEDLASQTVR
jgi:hypothetical protein